MKKLILVLAAIVFAGLNFWSCSDDKSTEPSNIAPVCSITFPPDSSKVTIGSDIGILLETGDPDGNVSEIELFLDNVVINAKSDSMFQYILSTSLLNSGYHIIKATATDDEGAQTSDEISLDLTNELTVILISPNGGETFAMGSSNLIKWQSNLNEPVKIDLYKSGEFELAISSSTVNDGEYSWAVPADLSADDDYSIMISGINSTNVLDTANSEFSIVQQSNDPYITVLDPNDSEIFLAGETKEIKWSSNIEGNVKIELFKSGSFYETIQNNTLNDGSYEWVIPTTTIDGIDYQIRITSLLLDNVSDLSDNVLKIMRFCLTSQSVNVTWEPDSVYNISWEYSEFISDLNVNIELRKNGVYYSDLATNISNGGLYNLTLPYSIPAGENYQIRIRLNNDVTIFDDSDGKITISKKIRINSPNGSETLLTGRDQPVTWTDNFNENVKIDLYKNGIYNSTIANNTQSDGNYSWNVSSELNDGSDYKIKISSVDSELTADESNNNINIAHPVITIGYPNGAEMWQVGSSQTVTWTDNIPENVKIELYKNGIYNTTVTSSTPSDGSHTWAVPSTFTSGEDYTVVVTSTLYSTINDSSDSFFTVPPVLNLTNPDQAATLYTGFNYSITWTDNIPGNVKIELYKGAALYSVIAGSTESDGSYGWTLPLSATEGTDYKIKISGLDETASDESSQNFAILSSVTVTYPVAGEVLSSGETYAITWTDYLSENVKIDLYKNGVFNTTIISSTPSTGSYNWTVPYTVNTASDYRIRISGTSSSGIYDESDSDFEIPRVFSMISPNGDEKWFKGIEKNILWKDNIGENVKIHLYKNDVFYYEIAASTWSDGIYIWVIPDNITIEEGNDYSVRIESVTDGSVYDTSDSVFTIFDRMVFVQGGSFVMGDQFSEGDSDELPLHNVSVSDFYMSRCELTQYEWSLYMVNGATESNGFGYDYPAYSVHWSNVLKYCNFRSIAEGLIPCYSLLDSTDPNDWFGIELDLKKTICNWDANGYRMPTEAEWEYAARGGIYSSDNYRYGGTDIADEAGWSVENSGETSHPVASKLPNQLGLYDMSGNVAEWCWDRHDNTNSYYQSCYNSGSVTDPTGLYPANNIWIIRGGSAYYGNTNMRNASRQTQDSYHAYPNEGVRIVRRIGRK